jgi:membrane protein
MASKTGLVGILKRTVSEFIEDECMRLAASLSYYTVFSLPSLMILILLVAGAVWDPEDVRGGLAAQIDALMGPATAEQLRSIISEAADPGGGGRGLAAVLGIAALIFGATGAFVELQAALNRAWGVEPDPDQGGLRNFIVKRLFSVGMVLSIAFLLLVSLVLSAALAAFGGVFAALLPGDTSEVLLQLLNYGISLVIITLLFAAMFRVLPDAVIQWRDVWVGAFATTVLFLIGKFLIGLYLGQANPGEAYGAAGSLAILLVWIYYSSLILLLGAEFTQVWAEERGSGVEPQEGAVRVTVERHRDDDAAKADAARQKPRPKQGQRPQRQQRPRSSEA